MNGLHSKALFGRIHITDGVPPPPPALACSPHDLTHVRPPLRLSFTLISNAMGCTGTSRRLRRLHTWSQSLNHQLARGARTRGPARAGSRHRQVWDVPTAARRHVRRPEALIDQFVESLSDVHVPGSPLLMACSRSVSGQRPCPACPPALPAWVASCVRLRARSGGEAIFVCFVFLSSSGGEEAARQYTAIAMILKSRAHTATRKFRRRGCYGSTSFTKIHDAQTTVHT